MLWPLLQIPPPPDTGAVDRWITYVLVLAVVALFAWLMKKSGDAETKADKNAEKWETTAKKATDELYEANRTIGRAIDTLERQGALMEAQAKDLMAVKLDGTDLKRVLAGVEQEVRALRETARRPTGDD